MKIILIILVTFLISCSGSRSVTKHDGHPEKEYDESFDPMTLDDNDIEFPSNLTNVNPDNNDTIVQDDSTPGLQKNVNGFRIQLIATQNLEKASLLEEEAKNQFSIFGHKTYLVFEAPLYKIRVGDFIDRNDADEVKIQAVNYGYREAFIVRTKVTIAPK